VIELLRPWWLLLLPFALWTVHFCWSNSGADIHGRRSTVTLILRLLATSVLVLGLAGLSFPTNDRSLGVVFALDASDSMRVAAGNATRMERGLELVRGAARSLDEETISTLVVFGEQAWVEVPARTQLRPGDVQVSSRVRPHATNIASALNLAIAAVPDTSERRVVLLTDGIENQGSAAVAQQWASTEGVEVLTVPLGRERVGEVVVREVSAPSRARIAEPFEVRATIAATLPTAARVELYEDGTQVDAREVMLQQGINLVRFTRSLRGPGMHFYDLLIPVALNDTVHENNRGSAFVKIQEHFSVLYMEGAPGESQYLEQALQAQDIYVSAVSPSHFPGSLRELDAYDAIIISDVSAFNLTDVQLKNIESYVHDLGGGLVMVGGTNSFGPGGWLDTPVERALPVNMSARRRDPRREAVLGLVIDKSGSMGDGSGTAVQYGQQPLVSKMDMAKEAAIRVTEFLNPNDYVFVIAFDDGAAWVVHPTPAFQKGVIEDAIAALQAGGGTNLYPAMEQAKRTLLDTYLPVRHLIVLTDGQSAPGDFKKVTTEMAEQGITVTTVGVGADADVKILQDIAGWGNGRFYHTLDAVAIPRIFTNEALKATRTMVVDRTFTPAIATDHSAVRGIDPEGVPPLHGYVITEPKAAAEVLAVADKDDPLIAAWRYGLGKSAVFTSDCKSAWGRDWLPWEGYTKLWAQTIKWVARREAARGMSVFHDDAGVNHHRLTVDLVGTDDLLLNGADVTATVVSPSGAAVTLHLEQVSPGRYAGEFASAEVGSFIARVVATKDGEIVASGNEGLAILYSAELRAFEPDLDLLRAVSSTGTLLDEAGLRSAGTRPPTAERSTPNEVWRGLFIAALLLLPLEVLIRRVYVSREDVDKLLARFRRPETAPEEPVHTPTMGGLLRTKRAAREVEAFTTGDAPAMDLDDELLDEIPEEVPGPTPPPAPPPEPVEKDTHVSRLLRRKREVDDDLL